MLSSDTNLSQQAATAIGFKLEFQVYNAYYGRNSIIIYLIIKGFLGRSHAKLPNTKKISRQAT
ncbi:hypothetical protein MED92_10099 [Oceanospirillum sp. MED92]|uniref:Uncharacterized protein n=1 Tax=Neptuniibacter caesariensis TaxID=207954 RepID=A0A7U8C8B4_NEPCE|nr:hypothetical protein MED92_10099 [Oceanospirillum sp. MED92] [Neptuniibacter caesariensis]